MRRSGSIGWKSHPIYSLSPVVSGEILDRFIPNTPDLENSLSHSRFKMFNSSKSRHNIQCRHAQRHPQPFSLQNEYFLVNPPMNTTLDIGRMVRNTGESYSPNDSSPDRSSVTSSVKAQGKIIAEALGFCKTRILKFKPFKIGEDSNEKSSSLLANDEYHSQEEKPKKLQNPYKEVSFKVLDAPGLRNDYYSNTVSWAKDSNILGVGLGSYLYTWSEKNGTIPIQNVNDEIISCISFSYDGILTVGTKAGRVSIYERGSKLVAATSILKPSTGISSIHWLKKGDYFFTGDDMGDVSLYQYTAKDPIRRTEAQITLRRVFHCSQQQICGIDLSPDDKQMAIGSNENCCIVFDIRDLFNPRRLFILSHQAAIKAVAFCPWMANLLATGGGSKDRFIRFWHTQSGTLIKEFKTNGQVTSLIWSHSKKELLATFGFGNPGSGNTLLKVYSYPSMKVVRMVTSVTDMRVLTADISSDRRSICAGLSDQSVRLYDVWDSKLDLKTGGYDRGIYQSELIELQENVNTASDVIR